MKNILGVFSLVAISGAAQAGVWQPQNGASLRGDIMAYSHANHHTTSSAGEYLQGMHAVGYIQGVRDALVSSGTVCHNEELEKLDGNIEDVVMSYIIGAMSQNPRLLNESAYMVTADAWTKILPCPKK